jgi:hypothetical protein
VVVRQVTVDGDQRGGLTYQAGTEAAFGAPRVIKEMRVLPTRILLASDVSEEAYRGVRT